jgi:hypothetical protein
MKHKILYRLYREEKLMVRRRGGRKRAVGTRAPMLLPAGLINAGVSTSSLTPSATANVTAVEENASLVPPMTPLLARLGSLLSAA